MKLLAVVLVALNGLLWFGTGWLAGGIHGEKVSSGRLPRVAELEVVPSSANAGPVPLVGSGGQGAPVPVPVNAKEEPAMSEICVEIGGFPDQSAALRAAAELSLGESRYEVRRVELAETPYFWVIVPPAASRAEAAATFRELQRRDLDSYLVTEGDYDNAVSLGLFAAQDRAESLMEERNSQGIETMLARLPRNRISYALVFDAGSPSDRNNGDSWRAAYEGRYDSVEFSECKGVATAENNP